MELDDPSPIAEDEAEYNDEEDDEEADAGIPVVTLSVEARNAAVILPALTGAPSFVDPMLRR